jgi:sn-glycerol 3-phosphate transport system ATP-binding protein
MAYGLRMRGMKKNLVKQRVDEVAQLLQLKDFLYKKPGLLSGGQRQRVAMGRAIVRSPAVFLFDEPLSNLDAKLRTEMRHEIKKLHQKLNTTCLYVTHDQTEAMTLADRVVVLNKGRIEQIGTPRELYDQPATLFVASFIGHYPMNFISGEMDTKNQVFVSDTGCVHPLPRLDNTLLADDQVSLGFRSEHLRIVPQPGPNSISGNIEFVDDMGADKLVQLVTDDGNLRLSVRIPVDQPINGPSINVAIEMQYINVFSHSTGRRLNDTIN